MTDEVTVTNGPWRARWTGGSRADVYHLESDAAVDSLNLWDHERGDFAEPVTRELLAALLAEWVEVYGLDYSAAIGWS